MPNVTPIQQSFEFGEISPEMFRRSSFDGYQAAAREMVNFIADSRGPVRSRVGFRHLGYAIGEGGIKPPVAPTACPTDTTWSLYNEGTGEAVGDRVGERVEIAADANSMVVASFPDAERVSVWERYLLPDLINTAWRERSVLTNAPEDPIQSGAQQFGVDIALCETLGLLIVGTPKADINGVGLSAGALDIYTGDNNVGWTFNNRLTQGAGQGWNLGAGVGISADGQTLVSTMPSASVFNTYTYDGGVTYTFTLAGQTGYPTQTHEFAGRANSVVLSADGQVLFVGDPDFGVGSNGRVLVYDRNGLGGWTLRQEIPRVDYGAIGAPGGPISPDLHRFGQGVAISGDLKNLLISIPLYSTTAALPVDGMICFYLLNEDTGQYEFCSYLIGDKGATNEGWGAGIDLLFNQTYRRLFTGAADLAIGNVNSEGQVYEYIGTPA